MQHTEQRIAVTACRYLKHLNGNIMQQTEQRIPVIAYRYLKHLNGNGMFCARISEAAASPEILYA
jgi:hypothetical protein